MEEDNPLTTRSRIQRTGFPTTKVIGPRSRPQADNGTLVRSSSSRNVATESFGAQTGSSQQGSFFQSSRNVSINGGEFNSSRLHHTNLTINFNQSGNEESVDIDRSRQAPSLKTSPHGVDYVPQDDLHLSTETGSSQRLQERYTENSLLHQSPLPVRKSSDLYYRHLATRGRGSPLWIPEPNRNLPIEYQRKGISIGDVGILTDNGGFDFLFNICLPQSDPINPEEMPEDFHPLKAPGTRDIINNLEFKANSYLASSSVKSSQRDGESFGLTFESPASEGAILTMPCGSLSRDLTNKITFKKYASANVVKWYRYVNEVCGREANNGDVRLVVGINPATAWGMATFANLSEQSAFLLRFKPTGERNLGAPYGWEYSGTAEVKSGPDTEEIDRLRKLDREAGQEGSDEYENQTLFVRTINVTIQGNIWNKLSAEWEELYLDDDSSDSVFDKGDHSFGTLNLSPDLTGGGTGPGGGASNNALQDGSPSFQRHKRFQSVYLSELPSAIASHPSKIINRLLLERKPNSSFAITEDDEWIAVIKESDKVLPPPETLFARIMETHDICEEEGAVFFQPKNAKNYKAVRQIDAITEDSHLTSEVDRNVVLGSPRGFYLQESVPRPYVTPKSKATLDDILVAQGTESLSSTAQISSACAIGSSIDTDPGTSNDNPSLVLSGYPPKMPGVGDSHGPSYISSHSADSILSDIRPMTLEKEALHAINVFLDEVLFRIINNSRSLSTDKLRETVLSLLPAGLGKEALLEAEVELRAYWERTGTVDMDYSGIFNQEWAFELLRRKCEAYSTLNEVDEDPIALARINEKFGKSNPHPPSNALLNQAALFLTAILETICERILSHIGRVAARDISRTTATVIDLFVTLREDTSVKGLLKDMEVFGQITAMKGMYQFPLMEAQHFESEVAENTVLGSPRSLLVQESVAHGSLNLESSETPDNTSVARVWPLGLRPGLDLGAPTRRLPISFDYSEPVSPSDSVSSLHDLLAGLNLEGFSSPNLRPVSPEDISSPVEPISPDLDSPSGGHSFPDLMPPRSGPVNALQLTGHADDRKHHNRILISFKADPELDLT